MSLSLSYNFDTYKWTVNGKAARMLQVSEGTRAFIRHGSDSILKVDRDIPQSLSEFTNYHNAPLRWRKYLAPALDSGPLPNDCQYWEFDDDRTFGWVLQKRIPILRLYDWKSCLYRSVSRQRALGLSPREWYRRVDKHAQLLDDFALDLIQVATNWCDGGQRQYSVVKGRVLVHDYASCRVRSIEHYRSASPAWENFTNAWAKHEEEMTNPTFSLDTTEPAVV
jgi:hypothetical protein